MNVCIHKPLICFLIISSGQIPEREWLGQNFWHFFKPMVVIKEGVQMCGTYLNNKNSGKVEICVGWAKPKTIREDFLKEVGGARASRGQWEARAWAGRASLRLWASTFWKSWAGSRWEKVSQSRVLKDERNSQGQTRAVRRGSKWVF